MCKLRMCHTIEITDPFNMDETEYFPYLLLSFLLVIFSYSTVHLGFGHRKRDLRDLKFSR
jgi:hypothetical protein